MSAGILLQVPDGINLTIPSPRFDVFLFPQKGRKHKKQLEKKQILHRQIIHVLKGTSHLIYQKLRKQSGMCIKKQESSGENDAQISMIPVTNEAL